MTLIEAVYTHRDYDLIEVLTKDRLSYEVIVPRVFLDKLGRGLISRKFSNIKVKIIINKNGYLGLEMI